MLTQRKDNWFFLVSITVIMACNVIAPGKSATHQALSLLSSAEASSELGLTDPEPPGPSANIYTNHFYSCTKNFWVSTTGNDTNPGTQSSPWQTLQHANNVLPTGGKAAGSCVNVAPGTYGMGVHVTAGGNYAGPAGYVAYRCQALDTCVITANGFDATSGGSPAFGFVLSPANYVVIDGFDLAAALPVTYANGVVINDNDGPPNGTPASHHIWVINNLIHGYGQGGVGTDEADWIFVLHNVVYDNASVTCDAQGSGIGLVVAKHTPNYTPTPDDATWAPFHQVVAKNYVYHNMLTKCGTATNPYDTDGNGIIIDTFNGAGVDNILYPDQTLVAWNIVSGNGGKGIAVFRSAHITVANNTARNNNLDPWNQGYPRGEINNAGGFYNSYFNNIAYSMPAASPADPRCQGADYDPQPAPCPLMANVAFLGGSSAGVTDANNVWLHNISRGGNPPFGWGPDGNVMLGLDTPVFVCVSNLCNVKPLFANLNTKGFAIRADSPAIDYGITLLGKAANSIDVGACPHILLVCN